MHHWISVGHAQLHQISGEKQIEQVSNNREQTRGEQTANRFSASAETQGFPAKRNEVTFSRIVLGTCFGDRRIDFREFETPQWIRREERIPAPGKLEKIVHDSNVVVRQIDNSQGVGADGSIAIHVIQLDCLDLVVAQDERVKEWETRDREKRSPRQDDDAIVGQVQVTKRTKNVDS